MRARSDLPSGGLNGSLSGAGDGIIIPGAAGFGKHAIVRAPKHFREIPARQKLPMLNPQWRAQREIAGEENTQNGVSFYPGQSPRTEGLPLVPVQKPYMYLECRNVGNTPAPALNSRSLMARAFAFVS
jgi:hypothetical protein